MLLIAMNEMRKIGTRDVWCVTRKNHPYWSQLMDFKYMGNVHITVSGEGYLMKLQ
jgi:hypothetical protein